MLRLPASTEYNKRIPKQKFYDNISVTPAMKKIFVEKIKSIYWRNKIATSTINLAAGDYVTEIEIFEVKLEEQNLDESVLRQIDREIPYHIVFLLEYDGLYQAWTAYKESAIGGKNAFKVDSYYHTDWLIEDDIPLLVEGLNIDSVYENFVRQIAGDFFSERDLSLKESVCKSNKRKELQKRILKLETQVRNEKQFNKQVELNDSLKQIKKELEDYE